MQNEINNSYKMTDNGMFTKEAEIKMAQDELLNWFNRISEAADNADYWGDDRAMYARWLIQRALSKCAYELFNEIMNITKEPDKI